MDRYTHPHKKDVEDAINALPDFDIEPNAEQAKKTETDDIDEQTTDATSQAPRAGRLIVISGPSGVGKSTITKELLRRTGAVFSVSATTRPPRPGEVDGREYRFVDALRSRK